MSQLSFSAFHPPVWMQWSVVSPKPVPQPSFSAYHPLVQLQPLVLSPWPVSQLLFCTSNPTVQSQQSVLYPLPTVVCTSQLSFSALCAVEYTDERAIINLSFSHFTYCTFYKYTHGWIFVAYTCTCKLTQIRDRWIFTGFTFLALLKVCTRRAIFPQNLVVARFYFNCLMRWQFKGV